MMTACSSVITSSGTRYQPSCFRRAICLVLYSVCCSTMVSCFKSAIPYSKHCSSIVPEHEPSASPQVITIPFVPNQVGFFFGGDEILNHGNSSQHFYSSNRRKSFLFQTHNVYSTDADDIYKVEATLTLHMGYYVDDIAYSYSYSTQVVVDTSQRGPVNFKVEGFWSKSTGRLCMVGSGSTLSTEGKIRVLTALLKLSDVESSSNITSLVRGTLESLSLADDSSYFPSISLLMFPQMNYKYTKEPDSVCTGAIDVPKHLSLSLPMNVHFCPIFRRRMSSFKLEYDGGCNPAKSCNPFGQSVGYLPQVTSLNLIQCSDDTRSLSFLLEFPNSTYADYYSPFTPNTTLVAEGSWDTEKNQLCVVACRILGPPNSLSSSHIEDCSIRLSLRFPAIWSIRDTSGIMGQFWSSKTASEPGYFNRIVFRSAKNIAYRIPGLKYNYTFLDKARKSCEEKKPGSDEGTLYPEWKSSDMGFDMSVRNSKGKRIGWGYAEPIAVGDEIVSRNAYWISSSSLNPPPSVIHANSSSPKNISYQMRVTFFKSSNVYPSFHLSAEGTYDDETGSLCMVGCKYLYSNNQTSENESLDCKIVLNFQFPPIRSNDHIKGSIKSKREMSDPQYLEPLSFTAVAFYKRHSRESEQRMDLEIIMALISNALICIFVVCQILHVKKHPSVLPCISLLMLVVLTLGLMIPLVLNFEALFLAKGNSQILPRSGGWVEVNEVIVRLATMLAFILQFRLLMLVWSARSANGNQKSSWIAEKRTLCVCVPLYLAGCLIVLFVNRKNSELGDGMQSTYPNDHQHSLWAEFICSAGLVVDGFLLPQILLNIFQNSRQNSLSRFFYVGITFVCLLPHAYDLYRTHYYVEDFDWSYMYADPGEDYYSTSWDVIIPLGGLLFTAIIHLQQHFGGRCLLPKRFKEQQEYGKVPMADDA